MKRYGMLTVPILLIAFVFLFIGVQNGSLAAFDERVFGIGSDFARTSFPFFRTITYFGGGIFLGIGCLIVIFLLWLKERNYLGMSLISLGVGGGQVLNKLLKELIHRERPMNPLAEASGYSFPSGHAMMSFIFFTLAGYFLIRGIKSPVNKWGAGLAIGILIVLIGFSRVVIRVHFPTDVLAGFLMGTSWSIGCLYLYGWLKGKNL